MSTPGPPGQVCPRCAAALSRAGDEAPWCPDCEWNLGALPAQPSRLRRRLDANAFEVDERIAGELAGRPPRRPGWSRERAALIAASLLLGGGVLALLITGLALVLSGSLAWKVVGALLVLVTIELRPRLPRLGAMLGMVGRSDQPALFEALDRVCAEVAAPRLAAVVLDESFDANCRRYGLRQRPVLHLGLPLWASLSPSGRLALLTHEVGHLVNGDPGSGLLAQPALCTLGNLARIFDPRGVVRRHQLEPHSAYDGAITSHTYQGMLLFEWIGNTLSSVLFAPVTWACTTLQFSLLAMSARARRTAEYYADALAADVAGTHAMTEYLETLLLAEPVSTAVRRWLRVGADVGMLQAEAQDARERHMGEQRRAEQRSIRTESDVLADHPPIGRRIRVVRSWPVVDARLPADEVDLAGADIQLGTAYRRVERALSHLP